MDENTKFLKDTLKLAKKGLSYTYPNPLVGAVIVKNSRIIGQSFHHKVGDLHAEIEALNAVTDSPKDATLYVNLEPCSTFGKTPPCVSAIIRSKIKKVVCCSLDPNPKNHGQGIAGLQKAGVKTTVGPLEHEARILNEAFFTFHEKKRPFVAIKFASSLDGKIATKTGNSQWITNEKARIYARSLRAQYQAILVGINTVLTDNPHLGVRIKGKKDPVRIILDSGLRIPLNAKALRDSNVIIATANKTNKKKTEQLEKMGVIVLVFDGAIPIPELLSRLREREIISILVEGGGQTLGSFIDAGTVDKIYAFHAPVIIGGKDTISIGGYGAKTIADVLHLKNISRRKIGDSLLTTGYIS